MLQTIGSVPVTRPAWISGVFTLVLIVFLGFIDHVTGYEISFSVFYLLPISIAVWYSNRTMGYVASAVSASTWGVVERLSALPYSQQWILYWNSAVRLTFFIVVAYLLAELRTNLRRQQRLARTDALTGLLNRSGFVEHAGELLTLSARYEHATTVAFADLDGFKKINDRLGHAEGDEVLKLIARLLAGSGRGSDLVARFGGDEFAILLPHTGAPGARNFFEKFRQLARTELDDREWRGIDVSIGAIVFENGTPELGEALRLADGLMYRAKEPGSGGLVIESTNGEQAQ